MFFLAALVLAAGSAPAFGGTQVPEPLDPAIATAMLNPPVNVPDGSLETTPPGAITPQPALHALQQAAIRQVSQKIRRYQKSAWHWQSLMGLPHTRSGYSAAHTKSVLYARWVLKMWVKRSHRLHNQARRWMVKRTNANKQFVAHWSLVLGYNPLPKAHARQRLLASAGSIESNYNRSRIQAQLMLDTIQEFVDVNEFGCIHHYEGAWTSNTGNGYYGGLQMDISFMSSYGGYLLRTKGTADHWTPLEQMVVAQKAHDSGRGFGPWPNTARACGLLS